MFAVLYSIKAKQTLLNIMCSKCITKNQYMCDKKKITKKQILIDNIFSPNKDGISEWKTRDELANTRLKLTDNGNCRHGKFYNDNRYIWEKNILGGTVISIRTIGFDKEVFEGNIKRTIRKDIKDYHYKTGCVVCGCSSSLVIDHKNDLYNDLRVLNIKTQLLSDFQCLCTHCNLQKRQVCKKTKEMGIRYGATNIESLKIFGIDFISGGYTYDKNDINALKGTYWYDPTEFMKFIHNKLTL